jgi:hypothetical protein
MSTTTIPLTSKEKQRRSDLLQRFKEGTLHYADAQELRNLLEREKYEISQYGNCLSFLAVTFLMDCVDEYLEGNNNSKLLQNTK